MVRFTKPVGNLLKRGAFSIIKTAIDFFEFPFESRISYNGSGGSFHSGIVEIPE
jgi:hypothetical protein